MSGCNCSFIIGKGQFIEWMAATGINTISLKTGMTARACLKETQYP